MAGGHGSLDPGCDIGRADDVRADRRVTGVDCRDGDAVVEQDRQMTCPDVVEPHFKAELLGVTDEGARHGVRVTRLGEILALAGEEQRIRRRREFACAFFGSSQCPGRVGPARRSLGFLLARRK